MNMEKIIDKEFEGERPLYCRHDLHLENVTVHAGESALKETGNITAEHCTFEGKYPFWECLGFEIDSCIFTEGARAALWYSKDCKMKDTRIDAPKMFREMDGIRLENVQFSNAAETLWGCRNIRLDNVSAEHADYIFMHSENIEVDGFKLNGNYSFQYCKNVTIRNSVLNTKDAFWQSENVTVYDSEINGEYLAWYSKNLRLVRCHISETQPLCYCDNLVLEDCTFGSDADLAFEYSSVKATVKGGITSVKNPRTGLIRADRIGEIILDGNIKMPADCRIETTSSES